MTLKVKEWKANQIIADSCKYGDKFWLEVERNNDTARMPKVENGYITFNGNIELVKETAKAVCYKIDGFTAWMPKSTLA